MKVLIIGLGSIAGKHIAALKAVVPNIEIHALRSNKPSKQVKGVINCYSLDEVPVGLKFIIISNPTSLHFDTIKKVIHLELPLFIEKPPLNSMKQANELIGLLRAHEISNYTAFNLRFHPIVQWLKENINSHRVIEVNAYCGSYLPSWRPSQDYREVYSAREELGGGVHLDLTHEIDYLLWIFGKPVSTKSIKRKISDLEITSVDSAKYWIEYEDFSINITLNYFRRDSRRLVEVITDRTTLKCDLLGNKVTDLIERKTVFEAPSLSNLDTYIKQMKYFIGCLETNTQPMNSIHESIRTLKICLT